MKKEIRLEEQSFKFIQAGDLIKQKEEIHSKKVKNNDDLTCSCLKCKKKREPSSNSDSDSTVKKNVYRQD